MYIYLMEPVHQRDQSDISDCLAILIAFLTYCTWAGRTPKPLLYSLWKSSNRIYGVCEDLVLEGGKNLSEAIITLSVLSHPL